MKFTQIKIAGVSESLKNLLMNVSFEYFNNIVGLSIKIDSGRSFESTLHFLYRYINILSLSAI